MGLKGNCPVLYTGFICQRNYFVCPRVNWPLLNLWSWQIDLLESLAEVIPWSDKGNKLNGQILLSVHTLTEYCSVRVCGVGDVVLHEGFCKRAPCYRDCIGSFVVSCVNLTHVLLWVCKKQWRHFTTFKPFFKPDVNIRLVWIPHKVGKTKVGGCDNDIQCYSHKWCWLGK